MLKLNQLASLGQSIWYDYIRRQFITRGELQSLIEKGLRGVTSNPSIFEKAITGSSDYDDDLKEIIDKNLTLTEIYEKLALKDINLACDLMLPVYERTDGLDGFVSIEVNPKLAHDTEGTIQEAKRLYSILNKPNVMIKVPATEEGIPAITELIGSQINVNVTLIFNSDNYRKVAEAYLNGLELLFQRKGDLSKVSSVASFFISRIDSAVDKELEKIGNKDLQGKIAIANAKYAYKIYNDLFHGPRWRNLEKRGANTQRLLWASTGSKNPLYPDTIYVDGLIGKQTVNTVPPLTFNEFMDHGIVAITLDTDLNEALEQLDRLKIIGIDLDALTNKLQKDGVDSFSNSFEAIMNSLKDKIERLKKEEILFKIDASKFKAAIDDKMMQLKKQRVVERIWEKDYTLWNNKPDEITNRLGWLKSPDISLEMVDEINEFVTSVKKDGFKNVLLLGMGGSSLAPEVFSKTFGTKDGYLNLEILDSTHPDYVQELRTKFNPQETLYVVSTKSGGTIETFSFMKYFYNITLNTVGEQNVSKHFVAITDPNSGLQKVAEELQFRKIFINDPNIGGRYSALSLFGIVPAALIGIDLKKLLNNAAVMVCNCEGSNCPIHGDNTPAKLGVVMGTLYEKGRDKITFITSNELSHFSDWVEQLIAESTGKIGKGILPIVGEDLLSPENYFSDRLFVYIKLQNDLAKDAAIKQLSEAGHPIIEITLKDIYDLGGEFFRWEMATAIAGWCIGIQPFDQPNVESAKILTRKFLTQYENDKTLPQVNHNFEYENIKIFANDNSDNIDKLLKKYFGINDIEFRSIKNEYIAIQAYVKPDSITDNLLHKFQILLQTKYKSALTVGYGPRFLHSTGQLHKGDAGKGVFIQLISESTNDIPIPKNPGDEKSIITFGTLIKSQMLGDRLALLDNNRKVVTFLFNQSDVENSLLKIINLFN